MSNLTPFGIAVRKLRLERGMRLLDLATLMDKTPAFLSAVETGRKPIPDGYVTQLSKAMQLNVEDIRALGRAVDRTRKEVRVETLPEDQRELVAAFARRLDEIPPGLMANLKKIVMKSSAGEVPFQRKRLGIIVPPMSTSTIRAFAEKVRAAFVNDSEVAFPIMPVLEFALETVFPGFYIDVLDDEAMGDDEGRMTAGRNGIALREDVYLGAWNGCRRDRFTACHELAHFLMHRNVVMARTRENADKIFCDSEWQADTFAGTLLMSARHLHLFRDAAHAAELCNINPAAAQVMWAKYREEGKFPASPSTAA